MMIIVDAIVAFIIMKLFPMEQSIPFLGILCMITFLRVVGDVYLWCEAFNQAITINKKETEEVK